MNRILIGITGGIGSGKSEVTAYLRQRGEHVICADEVAREVRSAGQPWRASYPQAVWGRIFFA